MQLPVLFAPAVFSVLVSSSVIGSAIAAPWNYDSGDNAVATPSSSLASYTAPSSAAPAAATTGPASVGTDGATGADLVAQLITAGTAVQRYKLLSPEDFGYDFLHPPAGATVLGMGGHTVKADRLTFPALVGTGVSMTVGFIGPCGFNTPHVHPRSAEFNIVVQGALHSEFIAENGADPVTHNATEFQAIVFPQGAVHTEFNPTCGQSIFVAGFGNEDPGVQQSAQTFFSLDQSIISAALGTDETIDGKDIETFKSYIPDNVAKGVEACLKSCNIKKRDYYPQPE